MVISMIIYVTDGQGWGVRGLIVNHGPVMEL
jgi:hypothetical protein